MWYFEFLIIFLLGRRGKKFDVVRKVVNIYEFLIGLVFEGARE